MTSPVKDEPQLERPGAGLPIWEKWLARYYFLPKFNKSSTWESALAFFQKEGQKILTLISPLSEKQMQTKVLVERIRGIEDSSRFWSVAMTIEHLMIVGELIGAGVVELTHGKRPKYAVNIAGVKPKGVLGPKEARVKFEDFLNRYAKRVTQEVGSRSATTTMAHPWFGEYTAYQWHCLAAIHQNTHRKQIQAILDSYEIRSESKHEMS